MRLVQADKDQVGDGAFLDYAEFALSSDCLGSVQGCHLQYVCSINTLGLPAGSLVDHTGRVHLGKHVQAVVAAAAVCAEADIDAGIQHLLCRCKSVAQFHIALGAEGNTDVLFSHNLDIFIRGINAVGRDTGNIELTQGIHILDGRRSVLLRDSVHFRLTFRQMDRLSDSAVFAGPGQFLQVVRHTAVWRMWAVDEAEAALIPEHLHFADSLSVFHN